MSKFKIGDLVYCTTANLKISKITKESEESDIFLDKAGWFKNTGLNVNGMPVILHATQENYELLSKLYPNVAFEPPPKRKEPRGIIKAMLKAGYDGVPCKTDCKQYRFVCVNVSDDPYFPFVYDSLDKNDAFSSAIPYCYQTAFNVICKTSDNEFKRHTLVLSDNVTAFVEQIEPSKVSSHFYRVTFKPSIIIPDVDVRLPK